MSSAREWRHLADAADERGEASLAAAMRRHADALEFLPEHHSDRTGIDVISEMRAVLRRGEEWKHE